MVTLRGSLRLVRKTYPLCTTGAAEHHSFPNRALNNASPPLTSDSATRMRTTPSALFRGLNSFCWVRGVGCLWGFGQVFRAGGLE